jgi:hypothetical protein
MEMKESDVEWSFLVLQAAMFLMTPEGRLELLRKLMEGYCPECGHSDPQGKCRCWDDS